VRAPPCRWRPSPSTAASAATCAGPGARRRKKAATFEIVQGEALAAILPELQAISDGWLDHHAGGEKGFSMGGFTPRYISEFPIAVVRQGRAGSLRQPVDHGGPRTSFSMDLMRYSDDAPKNIMDYLFVELIAWGREQGYTRLRVRHGPAGRARGSAARADHVPRRQPALRAR
jgi:lysylphosphatidylglycerol synthetase-like protein (DUF2156 family)